MKDSILWDKESDAYTLRAKDKFGDVYSHYDLFVVNKCIKLLNDFNLMPANVLDLGCAYGGFTHHLSKVMIEANFFGIDPGEESIQFARRQLESPKISFKQGYAHQIPAPDGKFDLIILNMVLQWIPRNYLARTIAEIDRVLSTDGVLFVQEFLPNIPKYSASSHDEKIFIFKDDYKRFFTSFPWLKLMYKENIDSALGDDYQKEIFLIRKITLDQAYTLKTW